MEGGRRMEGGRGRIEKRKRTGKDRKDREEGEEGRESYK